MATISSTIKINDAFSNPLDKLASGLSKTQSGFQRLKGALGSAGFGSAQKQSDGLFKSMTGGVVVGNLISKGMGLASSGIRSMVGELNEASVSWQTFEGNMHQIGKSPAEIAAAKKDMQKFAQQTIYSASDMSTTYSQLAAVGVKNTGKLVKGFGGLAASAANPAQAMKTISEQATQMAAKPKVQWMDFKLMLEQAPAGMSAVAKSMGMSLTQLIQKIQDGKVKTTDFLNAVAKTGTNANFSKMATQYKTVGQAMDGLKETLANGLQPQFQKLSQIGIDAISGLTDKLANLNWNALGDGLVNAVNYVKPALQELQAGVQDFISGFASTGVGDSLLDMFHSISDAVMDVTKTMNGGNAKGSFFTQLGKLSGGALSTVAKGISGIADAIGGLDPNTLLALARAFIILKGGLKGLILTEAVKGLAKLNEADPGTINALAKSLTALAFAFVIFKAVYQGIQAFGKIKDVIGGLGSIKAPKMQTPDVPKPGGILQSASAFLKLGAAILMVGGAIVLAAVGFKLLADSAAQLASGGAPAIATFFGMVVAIGALAGLVRLLGPGMIGASLGFLVFAAALLLIGTAVWIASSGIALLATQLPLLAQYGMSAALAIIVLGAAIALFGILAIVGAVGIIALSVALIVLAVGLVVASAGALIFAVALALLGVMALVASVGMIVFGVALMLVAVFAMVGAVGIMLLGVALMLVAVFAMVGAAGLILMGVALVLIAATAMIAAVGLILLGVSLMLIAPMALLAGVGLLLLGAGAMVAGAGLMLVAAAAMAASVAIMMIGVSVMVMVSLFIAAFAMLVSAAVSGMSRVRSAISNGISSAVSAVRGFVGSMASAGAALMQGLVNGIKSMIGSAVAAAQSAASQVAGAIKGFLHIGSPSRLMRQYGRWIDQGLINGINQDADPAVQAALGVAKGIAGGVNGVSSSIGFGLSSSPGDLLANGFDRALGSIADVASAIYGLDGSKANIGINGTDGSINSGIGSDSITSSLITPDSVVNGTGSHNTDNSQQININQGAITVQSTGNASYDADQLLTELENKVIEQRNKALG